VTKEPEKVLPEKRVSSINGEETGVEGLVEKEHDCTSNKWSD
jgi:DNA-binding FrmR family transcriptional regulator